MSKSVRIDDDVLAYIQKQGKFGESHSDVLRRLLPDFEPTEQPFSDEDAGKRYPPLFGHSIVSVIRWMETEGWTFDDARKVLNSYPDYRGVADKTIRCQLEGERRGKPAVLTDEQRKDLNKRSHSATKEPLMGRTIWVFGNADKRKGHGFPTAEDLRQYIRERVFKVNGARYRHTLTRNADVIVLSRHGLAYGRFEVAKREPPTEQDLVKYDITKQVYIVSCATLYEKPVRLSDLDIRVHQFGKSISEEQLTAIELRAGRLDQFHA